MANCRRAADKLAEAFVAADELAHWQGEDVPRPVDISGTLANLRAELDAFFVEVGRQPFEGFAHDMANLIGQVEGGHPQPYFQCACGTAAIHMVDVLAGMTERAKEGIIPLEDGALPKFETALLDEAFRLLEQHCAADFGDLQDRLEVFKKRPQESQTLSKMLSSMQYSFGDCLREAQKGD